MAAMQLPPATLYAGKPSAVVYTRIPNLLRSSSFLPYYSIRLLNNKKPLSKSSSSSAPRFSMRVSSKQAYICRDCGSLLISLSLIFFFNISSSLNIQNHFIIIISLSLDFTGIFTMTELHSKSYRITISVQVLSSMINDQFVYF